MITHAPSMTGNLPLPLLLYSLKLYRALDNISVQSKRPARERLQYINDFQEVKEVFLDGAQPCQDYATQLTQTRITCQTLVDATF